MPQREIVRIDEEKCDGCGLCVPACAEGAIQIIDGKAKLVSEIYCDGLGACLGHCPQDAITIEKRDAADFDEHATAAYLESKGRNHHAPANKPQPTPQPAVMDHGPCPSGGGCPGTMMRTFRDKLAATAEKPATANPAPAATAPGAAESQLGQWPVQLHLVSPMAPYFQDADLMLVADCVPFAVADFHQRLLKGRSIAIACPKLDDSAGYLEKLTAILQHARPRSLTVAHMEVPCCSGLTRLAQTALAQAGTNVPAQDLTIDLRGNIAAIVPLGK